MANLLEIKETMDIHKDRKYYIEDQMLDRQNNQ